MTSLTSEPSSTSISSIDDTTIISPVSESTFSEVTESSLPSPATMPDDTMDSKPQSDSTKEISETTTSSESCEDPYTYHFEPSSDPSYKVDWTSLCAIESRLVSEDQDAKLFVDQCNLKNKKDWDDYSLPTWPVSRLRSIIADSTNLPFNDIPNLPSIDYADSELSLWSALISDYRAVAQHIPKYASMMVRSGIPPALRGHAWKSMAESASPTLESLYDSLAAEWTPFVKIIGRDLNRTFPEIKMFREKGGYGQMKLGRVLRAYSAYDIQVGYCQGLTFLAGPLLLHMDDRSAFCTLIQLMEDYDLRSMFTADMAGLQLRMYQFESLFSEQLPELYNHFKSLNVSSIYASQWFLSFFAVTCPLSMLVRIFDLVFSEGAIPTLMRVALAVLGRNQRVLMAFDDDEQILQHMLGRCIWDVYNLDADLLITDVATVHVCTTQSLVNLETEFNEGGKPHMTNNTNSYSKPAPVDSSKRSVSGKSMVAPSNASISSVATASTTSSASSAAVAPINNVASYFTQLPWLKWQAPPAIPTSVNAPIQPNPSSETDLAASAIPDRSRFSVASFDSMSTANSGSSVRSFDASSASNSNRGSRNYGAQSSASSVTSCEGFVSAESNVLSKNAQCQVAGASVKLSAVLEENQILKDKVSGLMAQVEKLQFELQQRELLNRTAYQDTESKGLTTESLSTPSSPSLSEMPSESAPIPDQSNTSEPACTSCDKLRLELALAKTNETLANAEVEELRHSLAKYKSALSSPTTAYHSSFSHLRTLSTFSGHSTHSANSSISLSGGSSGNSNRRSIFVSRSNNQMDASPITLLAPPNGAKNGTDMAKSLSEPIPTSSSTVEETEVAGNGLANEKIVDQVDEVGMKPEDKQEAPAAAASTSRGWSIW